MNRAARLRGAWALTPLLVFLILYLGVSLWIGDFYKMPITVAFLAASAYGLCVIRRQPLEERIACFSRGAGHPDLLVMVWIFVLAGAFAQSAEAMGAVDAAVRLTLSLLPARLLLAGLFVGVQDTCAALRAFREQDRRGRVEQIKDQEYSGSSKNSSDRQGSHAGLTVPGYMYHGQIEYRLLSHHVAHETPATIRMIYASHSRSIEKSPSRDHVLALREKSRASSYRPEFQYESTFAA